MFCVLSVLSIRFHYLSSDQEKLAININEKKMNFKMKIIRDPLNGKSSDKQNFSIQMLGELKINMKNLVL